jgi:hypothetical protein
MKKKERKNKKHQSLIPAELKVQREKMNQRCFRNKSRSVHEDQNNKPSCSKINSPYKSPATLKKAVKQVAAHLPKSPRKCHKVVSEHSIVHGIPVQSAPNNKKQIHCLNTDTGVPAVAFYVQDISWQATGLKDFVIVRDYYMMGKKCKM